MADRFCAHCHRSGRLRINYVTQLSAFQETLGELQEETPDPASIIGLIAVSADHSPHQLKTSMVGFSISRKRLSSTLSISSPTIITCDASLIWWHLATLSAGTAPYLGRGVSPHGRPSWHWTWNSSSRPSCTCTATAPWTWGCSSRPPPLASGIG